MPDQPHHAESSAGVNSPGFEAYKREESLAPQHSSLNMDHLCVPICSAILFVVQKVTSASGSTTRQSNTKAWCTLCCRLKCSRFLCGFLTGRRLDIVNSPICRQ